MTTETDQTEQVLRELISCFVSFPRPHVCKHWCALRVLQAMEILGHEIPEGLERAVVRAEDETVLSILDENNC